MYFRARLKISTRNHVILNLLLFAESGQGHGLPGIFATAGASLRVTPLSHQRYHEIYVATNCILHGQNHPVLCFYPVKITQSELHQSPSCIPCPLIPIIANKASCNSSIMQPIHHTIQAMCSLGRNLLLCCIPSIVQFKHHAPQVASCDLLHFKHHAV